MHACIHSASILHTSDDGFDNSRNMLQYKTQVLRKTQDDSSVSLEQKKAKNELASCLSVCPFTWNKSTPTQGFS